MTLEFSEIATSDALKTLIVFFVFIILIVFLKVFRILVKKGSIKLLYPSFEKKKFLECSDKIIFFLFCIGLILVIPITYINLPEIILMFEKGNNSVEEKIIYANDIRGGNGYKVFDDKEIRYYFVEDKENSITMSIYEFEGEYCEIEYYEKSKVIKRISIVEDLDQIGKELTLSEIQELQIPDYPGDDAKQAPGEYWLWEGLCKVGDQGGYWEERFTGEKLNPDINYEQPNGPHWDYTNADGQRYRLYPDGRVYEMYDF